MATKPGMSGNTSKSIGSQVEGDHSSIGVGGGAPNNGGDGKQSPMKPMSVKGSPTKDVMSGDEGVPTV